MQLQYILRKMQSSAVLFRTHPSSPICEWFRFRTLCESARSNHSEEPVQRLVRSRIGHRYLWFSAGHYYCSRCLATAEVCRWKAAWLGLRRMLENKTTDASRLLWEYKLRASLKDSLWRILPSGCGWRLCVSGRYDPEADRHSFSHRQWWQMQEGWKNCELEWVLPIANYHLLVEYQVSFYN